jgi:hypothetical protein
VVVVVDKVLVQDVVLVLVAVDLAVVEQELVVVNAVALQVVLVAEAADQVVEEDNRSFKQLKAGNTTASTPEYNCI